MSNKLNKSMKVQSNEKSSNKNTKLFSSKLNPSNTYRDENNNPINISNVEFTRQMFDKLEKLSGTGEYPKEIANLLNTLVEPPNFSVNLPPIDNWPFDDDVKIAPVWYKDP